MFKYILNYRYLYKVHARQSDIVYSYDRTPKHNILSLIFKDKKLYKSVRISICVVFLVFFVFQLICYV